MSDCSRREGRNGSPIYFFELTILVLGAMKCNDIQTSHDFHVLCLDSFKLFAKLVFVISDHLKLCSIIPDCFLFQSYF